MPEGDDVSALTVTGDRPAVLAFVLVPVGGRVVLEILNEPGVPTVVYQAAGPDGLAAVNQALDDCGFQPGAGLGPPLAGEVASRRALGRRPRRAAGELGAFAGQVS